MPDEKPEITPPTTELKEYADQTTAKPQGKPVESLQTSEIRYRRLFEAARDGILILDADSRRITDVNPYMLEMLGYSREEFLGRELFQIGFLKDEAASREVYGALQQSGYVRYEDLPLETKSGRHWEVEFVCNLYDEDGHQVIQCNIRDNSARKQLEANKSLLASIVDSVDVSIISIDCDRIITSWNKGAEVLYGYSAEEALGQSWTLLTLPEVLQKVLNNIERIKQSKTVETFETEEVCKDGRHLHLSITLSPIKNAAGEVVGVSTLARDIGAQKQAEKALADSELNLRMMLEVMPAGAYFCDAAGLITFFNAQAELLWGHAPKLNDSADRFCGSFKLFEVNGAPLQHDQCWMALALQNRKDYVGQEVIIERPDGSRVTALTHAAPLLDESGQVLGAVNILIDITERKLIEQQLQLQAHLLDVVGQAVVVTDGAGIITYWNGFAEKLYGWSAAEALGRNILEVTPSAVSQGEAGEIMAGLARGESWSGEFLTQRRDGTTFPAYVTATPVLDEAGQVASIIGLSLDISDRKLAEEALRQQKELLQTIFDHIPVMISFFDADDKFQLANRELERVLGWSAEETISHPDIMAEFVPDPAERQRVIDFMRQASGESAEFKTTVRDGRILDTSWVNIRLPDDRRIGIGQDITERKQIEEKLRKSQRQLAAAQTLARVGSWEWDFGAAKVLWSDELYRILGYSPQQSEATYEAYMSFVHPDDREEIYQSIEEILREKCAIERDHRIVRPDGAIRVLNTRSEVTVDDSGQPVTIFGSMQDVTEMRQATAETQAAKAEAERANLAKSEFLSRMSHELRTPLNAILGFGQLLEMDELDDEQRQGVNQILKGGRHLLVLINEVLDIARIESGQMEISPEPVSVAEVMHETLDFIRPLAATSGISLHDEISATCPFHVCADRQRLRQVLINLIANAVKYNREGGTVTIACRQSVRSGDGGENGGGEALKHEEPILERESPTLCLEITDTGLGIPPHSMDRLFMPFERLGAEHSAIEGTGVGLALSKRLVELMGGHISAQSTLGEGSTFTVELPLAEAPSDTSGDGQSTRDSHAPHASSSAPPATHTVLYIEDNLSNRSLVESILLRRPQIALLSETQGKRGLEVAREHRPDLILLDLHLPDINGDEVLRRLLAESETRDIPVVMLSADATPGQIERLLEAGAKAYLTKPLDVKRFLTTLDENL